MPMTLPSAMLHSMEPNVQAIQPAANSSTRQPGPASGMSRPGSENTVIDSQLIRGRADSPSERPGGLATRRAQGQQHADVGRP